MYTLFSGKSTPKHADTALLILRLAAGAIFVYHGYGKLFAIPGIAGFSGFLGVLGVPLPAFFAWVVALVELVGGIALILGVYVSVAGLLLAVNMLVAFLLVSKGKLPRGDAELALFAIALALAFVGPGAYALRRGRRSASNSAT